MERGADAFISNIEKQFIVKAINEELRLDGRRPYDFRKLSFQFALDDSSATVQLGHTRVMTVVKADLEAPYPDRPTEGSLRFEVHFSPMASPMFEAGRPGEDAIELGRLIDRALRQSRAIDQEALCVMTGRKVWSLRVDVHVLDHAGNLTDAACLSALAALMAFRKPEVSVGGPSGTDIIVHAPKDREPTPLSIHHLPIAVTFAIFEDGNIVAVDPVLKEEASAQGSITVVTTPNQEVCAVQKADGVGLSREQLMRCVRLAATKSQEVVEHLRAALKQHEVARVAARVRRHRAGAAGVVAAVDPAVSAVPGAREGGDGRLVTLDGATDAAAEEEVERTLKAARLEEEDAMQTSSEEEDTSDVEMAAAEGRPDARGADSSQPSSSNQQQRENGTSSKPAARLLGSIAEPPPGHSGGVQAQPDVASRKPAAAQPSKAGKAQRADKPLGMSDLDAIAAIIAGAAGGSEDEETVLDLKAAIKRKR